MSLELLNVSDHLWVINKPTNLSLLNDRQVDNNLWQQIKAELGKPFLVHRLDKGTSGVLLVARDQDTQRKLTKAFARHEVHKHYVACLDGNFHPSHTHLIDLPLRKGRKSRYRVAAQRETISQHQHNFTATQSGTGVEAITRCRLIRQDGQHSLVALKPQHGRTHQLRVHLSWIGFPIVGDHLYGTPSKPSQQCGRLKLHCHRIVIAGKTYTAPLPTSFTTWDAS